MDVPYLLKGCEKGLYYKQATPTYCGHLLIYQCSILKTSHILEHPINRKREYSICHPILRLGQLTVKSILRCKITNNF